MIGFPLFPIGKFSPSLRPLVTAAVCVIAIIGGPPCSTSAAQIGQLRCEYLKDPLGIDIPQPRLSWVLEPDRRGARGQRQRSWQMLVAGSRKKLDANEGDLWDSGK